jgi:hypothetical protein
LATPIAWADDSDMEDLSGFAALQIDEPLWSIVIHDVHEGDLSPIRLRQEARAAQGAVRARRKVGRCQYPHRGLPDASHQLGV